MADLNSSVWQGRSRRRAAIALLVTGLQAAAAIFLLLDALAESDGGIGLFEAVVAVGLIAGITFAGRSALRLIDETRRQAEALDMARGAMSELIAERFRAWALSPSEADVALFALKGSTIAEIAAMRGAAEGTVRSQLSQVYSKADVPGQAGLMALFLDELVETRPGGVA